RLAHDGCAGQDVLDRDAAHGDRGAGRGRCDCHAEAGMSDRLTYTVAEGIARLTLNRPEKRNALDGAMVAALHEAVAEAERDAGVHVIAIQGAGSDFCAGADLAQLERIAEGAGPLENLDDATALGELFIRIRRAHRPVVALVHGSAIA